ncbi:adenosylcobinamide-phosphate synthase CbiB [Pleionea litopenaei]|uniref:Cobalamin biosynthesis protein CobD n=1 Tax=Pleionea litopenaei TaxID=3070815 RepID=A0AA51RR83_9GAMM|nr:adenosylcobinamide-phosphate synthase CbiB [Pleionea sp. HL-JVS1]WMS86072.1 adenosylcobinamide-phosphate synthase CbiB [Pleionea sp. HL-JVS1]
MIFVTKILMLQLFSLVFATVGWLLDLILGEPRRWHPLIGFGHCANYLEHRFNRCSLSAVSKGAGFLCWCGLVLPIPLSLLLAHWYWPWTILADPILVYLCIGHKSLVQHALAVAAPLQKQQLDEARKQCAKMVSRDTDSLSGQEISRAVCESVLENSHDAVTASLFYAAIGGAPLAILHRLSNTLDAMWGYRNQRFINFGWFAARVDDWLGWPSAKLTALLFSLAPGQKVPFTKVAQQAKHYKSLNGGWVMAAGAFKLRLQLGGSSSYFGRYQSSTYLGAGRQATVNDIFRIIQLVKCSVKRLLLGLILLNSLLLVIFYYSMLVI